jgi:hypothetical protein
MSDIEEAVPASPEPSLGDLFKSEGFECIESKREDHQTPFGTSQNFVFASFCK